MAILAADQIQDLVTTTLKDLGRFNWTQISLDLQKYHAFPQLMQQERVAFESGTAIQWNVMHDISNAAKNVGLFQVDDVNVGDVMTTATIPWRHTTTNYAVERRELAMNRNPARIVELIKVRRLDAMLSLAQRIEEDFWTKPSDSSDSKKPFGIRYWIVPDTATTPAGGFNGGNPSGFSGGAGSLDVATYPNWANWAAGYNTIDKDDAIEKISRALRKTYFEPPMPNPNYDRGQMRCGIYTTLQNMEDVERVGEKQNENLGRDVLSMQGEVMIRRCPLYWVPQLDEYEGDGASTADQTHPFIGIDWSKLFPVFLSGEYLNETTTVAPRQHTVTETHVDLTWNLRCHDRRAMWDVSKILS